jgi:alcohol dehydrogenase class IV
MRPPDISYLSPVYFGAGRLALLPELVAGLGISRPLLITDRALVELGMAGRLGVSVAAVFDDVITNPVESSAIAAAAMYREAGCDGIIALGGGSPLDLAKIVALLAVHEPPLEQYAIVNGGPARITGELPPMVAIPTTAGSGSEVGRAALLTLESGEKLGFLSKKFLPAAVICDPELILTMPPGLTAGTGMDALSHCVETYLSTKVNPVADAIALDGLGRGWRNIRRAVENGSDIAAREEMMLCSLMGGLAFQKSLGAVHSLSHPLGALTEKRLHHGSLNALFLPHVLRFNYPACPEKYERIAAVIGAASGDQLPELFDKLNRELRLPTTLGELGLSAADLLPLAEKAYRDHCTPTNPRPLSVDDCRELYLNAL